MSIHRFCQIHLSATMAEVREVTTVEQRKEAWAYKFSRHSDDVEFHGPADFYWHGGGCCLWDARAQGWAAWMDRHNET